MRRPAVRVVVDGAARGVGVCWNRDGWVEVLVWKWVVALGGERLRREW